MHLGKRSFSTVSEIRQLLFGVRMFFLKPRFINATIFKECISDCVTNYSYVGDTKIGVSIKKLMPTNAH